MSEYFEDLMTGLNEAIVIERGELTGLKTIYEIQPLKQKYKKKIKNEKKISEKKY